MLECLWIFLFYLQRPTAKAGQTQNNGKDVIARSHHATVVRTPQKKCETPSCVQCVANSWINKEQEIEFQWTGCHVIVRKSLLLNYRTSSF